MLFADSLQHIVGKRLPWNKARLKTLKSMIRSIIKNRSVNLTDLSTCMRGDVSTSSEYRKLQRFLTDFAMPLEDIGRLVLSLFSRPKNGWKLTMDRTNWKLGKTHLNILVIGVTINKVSIPVVWSVLPQSTKRGNSNTAQRIAIVERLLEIIPAAHIDVLTMDREFVGNKWLGWLNNRKVGFVVRIKKSHKVNGISAEQLHHSKHLKTKDLQDIFGGRYYFSSKKIEQGRDPFIYVISNKYRGASALKEYRKRWAIELLFSHLKKRGFNLEDTHVVAAVKLERLFGVVALCFLVTFSFGSMLKEYTELNASEKRKSIFRLGLERLMQLFDSPPEQRGANLTLADCSNCIGWEDLFLP